MKKLIMPVALALALALPHAGTAMADPSYEVINSRTKIYQHSFERGNVRCKLKRGDIVLRNWGENWKKWIYVITRNTSYWNVGCNGWIDKANLRPYDG